MAIRSHSIRTKVNFKATVSGFTNLCQWVRNSVAMPGDMWYWPSTARKALTLEKLCGASIQSAAVPWYVGSWTLPFSFAPKLAELFSGMSISRGDMYMLLDAWDVRAEMYDRWMDTSRPYEDMTPAQVDAAMSLEEPVIAAYWKLIRETHPLEYDLVSPVYWQYRNLGYQVFIDSQAIYTQDGEYHSLRYELQVEGEDPVSLLDNVVRLAASKLTGVSLEVTYRSAYTLTNCRHTSINGGVVSHGFYYPGDVEWRTVAEQLTRYSKETTQAENMAYGRGDESETTDGTVNSATPPQAQCLTVDDVRRFLASDDSDDGW